MERRKEKKPFSRALMAADKNGTYPACITETGKPYREITV